MGKTSIASAAVLAAAGVGLLAMGAEAQNTPAAACRSEAGGTANVAAKANAFIATLTPELKQKAQLPYERAAGVRWTNVPVAMMSRNGVRFGEMDDRQQAAARALISAAMSTCGRALFDGVQAADGVLKPSDTRNIGWDPGNYYIAFAGPPSARAPWMFQLSGHHIAYNIVYNGPEPSATPLFDGVEPVKFSYQGKDYEPLSEQGKAMRALATSIAALPGAKLDGTFRDITRGPTANNGDVNFPMTYPTGTTGRGVPFNSLNAQQKALVRAAARQWVDLPNASLAEVLLRAYTTDAALAETYVGFSGATDLESQGSYVRIDGPRMWIEMIVQNAVADPTKVHYHSIWRDKQADYGGAFKS